MEVFVKKQSGNKSVNMAERHADWWLFGGIYRPVYLQAYPKTHIEKVAIDAKADGSMQLALELSEAPKGYTLNAFLEGNGQKCTQSLPLSAQSQQRLTLNWAGIKPWDTEHPHLYHLRMQLVSPSGQVVHEAQERIGFRTIEFRRRDGFYLNGNKIQIKGINRHCFYPETGRTVSRLVCRIRHDAAKVRKNSGCKVINMCKVCVYCTFMHKIKESTKLFC